MQRRALVLLAVAGASFAALPPAAAHPTWEGLRRLRRRPAPPPHRVQLREVLGRVLWVVPADIAVGQELLHDERRLQVRALWRARVEGVPRDMASVVDSLGISSDVEILREGAG